MWIQYPMQSLLPFIVGLESGSPVLIMLHWATSVRKGTCCLTYWEQTKTNIAENLQCTIHLKTRTNGNLLSSWQEISCRRPSISSLAWNGYVVFNLWLYSLLMVNSLKTMTNCPFIQQPNCLVEWIPCLVVLPGRAQHLKFLVARWLTQSVWCGAMLKRLLKTYCATPYLWITWLSTHT